MSSLSGERAERAGKESQDDGVERADQEKTEIRRAWVTDSNKKLVSPVDQGIQSGNEVCHSAQRLNREVDMRLQRIYT
jgi:hypothetical protein